ncbi:ACT domain-containing protein [Melia azedarach]|uniref:ACT domain-containing protein n=1 Tax=Melia azedarach TaxID=155640 RepID=A0ACC1WVT9_MELAZ|nr:ACT domain-containing protein [Melia azedarach]
MKRGDNSPSQPAIMLSMISLLLILTLAYESCQMDLGEGLRLLSSLIELRLTYFSTSNPCTISVNFNCDLGLRKLMNLLVTCRNHSLTRFILYFISSFYIETEDRPGLLVKITKVIADLNIDVESAEIDTEGLVAKDKFCISYGGAALEAKLCELLLHSCRWRGI